MKKLVLIVVLLGILSSGCYSAQLLENKQIYTTSNADEVRRHVEVLDYDELKIFCRNNKVKYPPVDLQYNPFFTLNEEIASKRYRVLEILDLPGVPNNIKYAMVYNKLALGMTKDNLKMIEKYRYPYRINRSVGIWGTDEQWVYNAGFGPYLYFRNGILTSWQD